MRHRESKVFAEILNRLREGIHTNDDIVKLKERIFHENSELNPLIDIPHFLDKTKRSMISMERCTKQQQVKKYTIKSQDNVIGANSSELRDKIMKRITDDP